MKINENMSDKIGKRGWSVTIGGGKAGCGPGQVTVRINIIKSKHGTLFYILL